MDNDAFKKISDLFAQSVGNIDFSQFAPPEIYYPKIDPAEILSQPINAEETIIGDIKHKIEEQNKLVSQQVEILVEQNNLLADNYSKLKDMYDAQSASYKAAQEDLKRSRRYNFIMMIISVIAMIAAIAGPIVTILVS